MRDARKQDPFHRDRFTTRDMVSRAKAAMVGPFRGQGHRKGAFLAAVAISTILATSSTGLNVQSQGTSTPWKPADIVAVTGCGGISLHDLERGEPIHQAAMTDNPSRLSGNSDVNRWLATTSNGGFLKTPLVHGLERRIDPDGDVQFVTSPLVGDDFSDRGGIAVLPGSDDFLVAGGWKFHGRPDTYQLRRYAIPKVWNENAETQIGARLASFDIDTIATEIILADEGRSAHVLTEGSKIHTLDTMTLRETAVPVEIPLEEQVRISSDKSIAVGAVGQHASLSADERFLFLNQGHGRDPKRPPGLTVVDLQARTTRTQSISGTSIGSPIRFTGGIAVNRGWHHHGLIALHSMESIRVLQVLPDGSLEQLSRKPVHEIPPKFFGFTWGPMPSIAWSADGSKLIAAAKRGVLDEEAIFVVFDVLEGGHRLRYSHDIEACGGTSRPRDIFTANGLAPSPSPTGNPVQTPTPQPTTVPSPTSTLAPSPSATASSLPLPSETSAQPPRPTSTSTGTPPLESRLYLPRIFQE